jgi:hypothetical protein
MILAAHEMITLLNWKAVRNPCIRQVVSDFPPTFYSAIGESSLSVSSRFYWINYCINLDLNMLNNRSMDEIVYYCNLDK